MEYKEFLEGKFKYVSEIGFSISESQINKMLFPFQKDIVVWALRMGRCAIFAACGLGKTPIQLEWANQIVKKHNKPVLIFAPLAVSFQTKREGKKFGIPVNICRSQKDVTDGINITNYEMIDKFDSNRFIGVVLDESGIIKDFSGQFRNNIINRYRNTKYKLACTATPAPNDYIEIGNHAEFLNVMSRTEMLASYFVHDSGDTAHWRLKGHVKDNLFWQWMTSWAVMLEKPSDLGYDDDGFILPELHFHEHIVDSNYVVKNNGKMTPLIKQKAKGLMDRRKARKFSVNERIEKVLELIDTPSNDNPWLVWCGLNAESKTIASAIPNAVEVTGSDTNEHKEKTIVNFADGKVPCLVTKPRIAGHGMNFQICHNMVYVGLSDSYEELHQSVRRTWRFGQKEEVHCHIVISDSETSVLENIKRKRRDFEKMIDNMTKQTKNIVKNNIQRHQKTISSDYKEKKFSENGWTLWHGDCVEVSKRTESNSIDYTIFSPPFSSLYVYSNSNRDMGNVSNDKEFFKHFEFLVLEMYRTTKPGRLVSIHCSDIPAMKERDNYIGLKDLPADIVRMMQDVGFIYHSKVIIWKDPLIEVTRSKALGLMHKQIVKDSSRCRQGLPDYVVTFMKPGDNIDLISHPDGFTRFIGENEPKAKKDKDQAINKYSHHVWQRYAAPVWMDIRQGNTLNVRLAREDKDERHIAPLQLDVIERCLELWSNPGDLVCSWFAGIGSEGYVALKNGRKFLGVELKKSYVDIAVSNLNRVSKGVKKLI